MSHDVGGYAPAVRLRQQMGWAAHLHITHYFLYTPPLYTIYVFFRAEWLRGSCPELKMSRNSAQTRTHVLSKPELKERCTRRRALGVGTIRKQFAVEQW